jgi:hypothetical protein
MHNEDAYITKISTKISVLRRSLRWRFAPLARSAPKGVMAIGAGEADGSP